MRKFTRSETIEIPEGVIRVVIRGHDQAHNYGGQIIILNLDTEEIKKIKQGPEKITDLPSE
jgi:hypothetical protein